jgi:hypothetical protein
VVPLDSPRITRGRGYSGTLLTDYDFRVREFHPLCFSIPADSTSRRRIVMQVLQPRSRNLERFGLVRVRSPLLTESRLIFFPTGTEMFQFPALASLAG